MLTSRTESGAGQRITKPIGWESPGESEAASAGIIMRALDHKESGGGDLAAEQPADWMRSLSVLQKQSVQRV
jgi:hypothetical protein